MQGVPFFFRIRFFIMYLTSVFFKSQITNVLENAIKASGTGNRMNDYPGIRYKQSPYPINAQTSFTDRGNYLSDNLTAVIWMCGRITYIDIKQNGFGISFNFSGCYMSKFIYQGKVYIAHIHRGFSPDCASYWNKFVETNSIQVLSLFQPVGEHDWLLSHKKENHTIGGLILPDNTCYSILINKENSVVEGYEFHENLANSPIIR